MVEERRCQIILRRLQSYKLTSLLILTKLDIAGGPATKLLDLNILSDVTHVRASDYKYV